MPTPTDAVLSRRGLVAAGAAGLPTLGLAAFAAADSHNDAKSGKLDRVLSATHNGNEYTLPPLPYAFDALEPKIDALTMELHHDKHHQGYVDGLNKAVAKLKDAAGGEEVPMYGVQRDLAFNYAGHLLHSLFWAVMGPGEDGQMGGEPSGKLAEAVQRDFGGTKAMSDLFVEAGKSVKGSGWAILVLEPITGTLQVATANEHDAYFPTGVIPLMPCDVWEHAYYLSYQNRRAEYLQAFLQVVDWQAVGALYELHASAKNTA